MTSHTSSALGRMASLLAGFVFTAGATLAGPVEDLKPGHWLEIPNSAMAQVAPKPSPPGAEGPAAVITAASGGAYDSKRGRLIVWGGGSSAYSGNEVYTFDIASLKWTRLTEPSKDVGGYEISGYYPDGQPRGRHTYNYIQYLPPIDRFCSFGAVTMYPNGNPRAGNVDCLNLDTGRWERKANAITYGIGATSAYDPVTKLVWVHGSGADGFLAAFDAVKNTWKAHGYPRIEGESTPYKLTTDVDPRRRKYVGVGSGTAYIWDLTQPIIKRQELRTTGATEILLPKSPGFVYDPTIDRFVAWSGGPNVYVLNLDKRVWTRQAPAETNKFKPPGAASRGTFGRFRYIPSRNAYIVVNSIYENVFVYKLPQPLRAE